MTDDNHDNHRPQRQLVRQAMALASQLARGTCTSAPINLPVALWQESQKLLRLLSRAQSYGWLLAASRLQEDLHRTVRCLQRQLEAITERLQLASGSADRYHRASAHDLLADLVALHEEFSAVSFNRHRQVLAVTTEPITLEDVYLGPFQIRLDCSRLTGSSGSPYQVLALEPHPAAANSSVTHPHVLDEQLCEGVASRAIRQALAQGRLLDFFLIVANVLRSYNRDNPHVTLAEWDSLPCQECGGLVLRGDQWHCQKCRAVLCSECYTSCPGCDELFCGECVSCCQRCQQHHCQACTARCPGCGSPLCHQCLEEHERCVSCHESKAQTQSEPDAQAAAEKATPSAGASTSGRSV